MTPRRRERIAAGTGYLTLLLGGAAAAMERPWPGVADAAELPAFLAQNRAAVLAQSLLFLLSAASFLWFLGSVRERLLSLETGHGRATSIVFGAGMVGYGMNILGQAPQITLTLHAATGFAPATAANFVDLGFVMLMMANIPIAVMFAALAEVSLRRRVFPVWLGWLAAANAVGALVLAFSVTDPGGALAPQGWLSCALYLLPIVWLLATTTVMVFGPDPADRRGTSHRAMTSQESMTGTEEVDTTEAHPAGGLW